MDIDKMIKGLTPAMRDALLTSDGEALRSEVPGSTVVGLRKRGLVEEDSRHLTQSGGDVAARLFEEADAADALLTYPLTGHDERPRKAPPVDPGLTGAEIHKSLEEFVVRAGGGESVKVTLDPAEPLAGGGVKGTVAKVQPLGRCPRCGKRGPLNGAHQVPRHTRLMKADAHGNQRRVRCHGTGMHPEGYTKVKR